MLMADLPVSGSGDWLGFTKKAEVLARLLLETEDCPLSVGIYGPWGSGKSSMMNLLRQQLQAAPRKGKLEMVLFEPWKYQGVDNLIVPLMRNIAEMESFSHLREEVEKLIRVTARVLAQIFVGRLSGGKVDVDKVEKWGEGEEIPKDEVAGLKESFSHLVARAVGRDGKLVVFVDDLDRCIPTTALGMMEAMKQFFWADQCIYVVAADKTTIGDAVRAYYRVKGLEEVAGPDYLEKILEFAIEIPPLSESQVRKYLGHLQEYVTQREQTTGKPPFGPKAEKLIVEVGPKRPRKLKRLFNAGAMLRELTRGPDSKAEGPLPTAATGVLLLRCQCPDLATAIRGPEDIQTLRDLLGQDPPTGEGALAKALQEARVSLGSEALSMTVENAGRDSELWKWLRRSAWLDL